MESVAALKQLITQTSDNALLSQKSPCLLAASKGHAVEAIEACIHAGVTDFGENRVQEAMIKWPALRARYPHVRLHLIGPLQTNKLRDALELCDVIQTLDRPKLADAMAHEYAKGGAFRTRACYIQVNTGEESQKAGVAPADASEFIRYCQQLRLPVVGLMCVPPADQMPAPHFALLRQLALNHGLEELSMGMSGDFITAIRMGSSCVRIGTALFGARTLS